LPRIASAGSELYRAAAPGVPSAVTASYSALWGSLFRAVLEHSCSICKSLSSLWLRARVVLALCSGAVDLVTTFTGTEASRGVSSAARVARQSEPSGLLGPE
jgi:hypothetical protein